jgi:hypothetical protein
MEEYSEKKLTEYKNAVSEAKTKVAQLEGSKSTLLDQFKKEFGVDNLDDAEKMLKEVEDDKVKLASQIQVIFRKIEEQYSDLLVK